MCVCRGEVMYVRNAESNNHVSTVIEVDRRRSWLTASGFATPLLSLWNERFVFFGVSKGVTHCSQRADITGEIAFIDLTANVEIRSAMGNRWWNTILQRIRVLGQEWHKNAIFALTAALFWYSTNKIMTNKTTQSRQTLFEPPLLILFLLIGFFFLLTLCNFSKTWGLHKEIFLYSSQNQYATISQRAPRVIAKKERKEARSKKDRIVSFTPTNNIFFQWFVGEHYERLRGSAWQVANKIGTFPGMRQ